ncbi:TolC family protein [Herminiimonas contaminans]|uniref:TolC family protein n=1 Tax=Herminiimonas contaminans TaxID=1111140 RepID=A0ABS0EWC7_9BURK|nr:TolC family protein [Herminiimonas contaminans]
MSLGRPSDFTVRRAILSFIFVSVTAISQAAETPSFAALLQQSQERAPQLLEQAANVRAANADVRQASAWINPTLNATAENLGAPQSGGVSQRQDTYTVTQVFEIGGKRSARIEAAQLKSVASGARERQTRLAFASELAVVYATAEAMQQRKEVSEAELTRATADLRAAQALVKVGREAELRLAQARASMAAAQAAVQSVTADATEALERLSALVGSVEPYGRISHPFMNLIAVPRFQEGRSLTEAPAVKSAVAEQEAIAAQIKVEEKRWVPDLGVSIGMREFGWTNEKAATVGLTLTIPLFDRNKAGIDAAKERAISAAMRLEAVRLETMAVRRSAMVQVQASERRLEAAEQGEAAASEAYRLGRIGYDSGKTALLELLAIRRALSEAQASTIDAHLSRVRALATLSLAEGRNVFGEAP